MHAVKLTISGPARVDDPSTLACTLARLAAFSGSLELDLDVAGGVTPNGRTCHWPRSSGFYL